MEANETSVEETVAAPKKRASTKKANRCTVCGFRIRTGDHSEGIHHKIGKDRTANVGAK